MYLCITLYVCLSAVVTTGDDMQVRCVRLSDWASVYVFLSVSLCVFVCLCISVSLCMSVHCSDHW